MTAPDFMPVLGFGPHSDPSLGACAMEYASVLAGEEFADNPKCTLPLLAAVMQNINDTLDNYDRQRLLPLIPRVIDTNIFSEGLRNAVEVGLGKWAKTTYVTYFNMGRSHIGVVDDPGYEVHSSCFGLRVSYVTSNIKNPDALLGFLVGLLDEFDRLTGTKAAPEGLTPGALSKLAEVFA